MKVSTSMTHAWTRRAAALVVGTTAAVAMATPAQAGPRTGTDGPGGSTDGNGYRADAIHVEGHVSTTRRASVPAPPPLCWWEPWTSAGDPTDPEAVKEYWLTELAPHLKGHAAAGNLMIKGTEEFDRAIEAAEEAPHGVTWYTLRVNDAALPPASENNKRAEALVNAGCTTSRGYSDGGGVYQIPVSIQWFPTGDQPEPTYDPRVIAEYAYDVMDLVEPDLEWNPKIGEQGNAALVNLPTWLWVDEATSVGGEEGVRKVEADAGPVHVEVVATTDGVRITSPAGSRSCTVDEARTKYERGRDEDAACTIAFSRGSYGYGQGFPVDASVAWNASWTSNTGDSDTLPSRNVGQTTFIRVAQTQALVTEVD